MRLLRFLRAHWVFWLAALGVIAGATTAYAPGLNGPFVFDDVTNIAYNPSIQVKELTAATLHELATSTTSGPLQRPISMLSLGLNYYFSKFDPLAFKLTNLAIHIVTGIALFFLTWRLLRLLHGPKKGKQRWEDQRILWVSLAICAVWLLHPLNLTSVLYVVQRMASLAGMFTVFGLLGYTIGREQLIRGQERGIITIVASTIVFGSLAVFSKESGILLVPYVAVIELSLFRFQATRSLQPRFQQVWVASAVAVTVVAVVVALLERKIFEIGYWYRDYSMVERLLTQARAIWFYLSQIFVPNISQLSVFHDDFIVSRGLLEPPSTLAALIGIAALIAAAAFAYRRHAMLAFGLMWFFVGHSLESTVLPLLLVQEHRNYLAQFGIIAAIIYYVSYPYPPLRKSLGVRYGLAFIYLSLLAINTHARALHWKDEWTLYNVEVQNHPNSISANTMLGILFYDNGYDLRAEQHLRRAVDLSTYQSEPLIRLIQQRFVATKKAPPELLEELERRMSSKPFTNVTLWVFEPLFLTVRSDPALYRRICEIYEKAIHRPDAPFGPDVRENSFRLLGTNYASLGDYRKALINFEHAMELNPSPQYLLARADIHIRLGEKNQAKTLLAELHSNKFALDPEQKRELARLTETLRTGS
jgi:tetratricopeptide (TPR) repeat protein